MKEFTIKLEDKIADYLSRDADAIGVRPEDNIRYILGRYVREISTEASRVQHRGIAIPINIGGILKAVEGHLEGWGKDQLKKMAKDGALSCKNCTMKLKPEDIDNRKCGACGVPLVDALGGQPG